MENKVLVETSARHIHLTAEAVEVLYGKGAELTVRKPLSQPGQFAAGNDKITLVGPKGTARCQRVGSVQKRKSGRAVLHRHAGRWVCVMYR